jgi:rhodanese-related sulfurtransferase
VPALFHRDNIPHLSHDGGQSVEVLPADECQAEHLPAAMSIPLKTLDEAATIQLDKMRPVIIQGNCWTRYVARLDGDTT